MNQKETMKNIPPDKYVMPFGKHKGKTLSEIKVENKAYLQWAASTLTSRAVRRKIIEFLEGDYGNQIKGN